MISVLEPRRLFAADFNPQTGVLSVVGSNSPDRIEVAIGTGTFTVFMTIAGEQTQASFDTARVSRVDISGLGGADTIILGNLAIPSIINGGKANDSISAGRGADTLFGNGGDDYIFGGDGKDRLDGGSEGDDLFGGGSTDTIDYSARTANLSIGLGTLPDDGAPGEGDNVRTDIEVVLAGSGNDVISTRSGRAVQFFGGAGDDTLIGGSGNDTLSGGAGRDSMLGNGGNDTFHATDSERDTLVGGSGTDNADDRDIGAVNDSVLSVP